MEINVEKFVKDYNRMCNMYISKGCYGCPVDADDITHSTCERIEKLEFIAPIVQKWSEEHQAKTYLMDFKEKFPNSPIDDVANGFCLRCFYGENAVHSSVCKTCTDCWNREME